MLSDEQIIDIRRHTSTKSAGAWADTLAFARAVLAAAVPPGHVVVPVEPTEAMLRAANEGDREYTLRNFGNIQTVMQGPYDHWTAMVEAAQKEKQ